MENTTEELNEMSYFDLCALARTKGFDEDVPYIVTDEARQRLIAFLTPPKLPTEERPQHSPQWQVIHDGPSRPIIETSGGRWLSLSQFVKGRWETYEEEEADAALFISAVNASPAVEKLVEAVEALICRMCDNRIGWKDVIGDNCASCATIRKALAPFEKQ